MDRIAITVVMKSKDLYDFAYSQLYGIAALEKDLVPKGKITVVHEQYCTRLSYYPAYNKNEKRRIAVITVGANILFGVGKLHRYFTLTLHPSQFKGQEFADFKETLSVLLPEFNYEKLFYTGKVNYVEFAADSHTHQKNSFLPYRKYCKESDVWPEPNGDLGTTYLGGKTSDLRFAIYDKSVQLIAKGKSPITKHFPHTRIEARMRRLGITAAELKTLKNPFSKLLIADLAAAQALSPEPDWQDFLTNAEHNGVPKELSANPALRKQRMKSLGSVQVKWWSPVKTWGNQTQALAAIAP